MRVGLFRREYRRGDDLTVHLQDDSTTRGLLLRESRRFLHLREYSIESGGALRRMKGDVLLVPRSLVKLIEANAG